MSEKQIDVQAEPDWNMAAHWIDRYAAGIDEYVQLDRVCAALGVAEPPEDWAKLNSGCNPMQP